MDIKKDKAKVVGEFFDDERIKTFLQVDAYGSVSRDYCALERAYRGMIAENFATFVQFFCEAGMDINSKGPDGRTFLQVISNQRHAGPYIDALQSAGAQ